MYARVPGVIGQIETIASLTTKVITVSALATGQVTSGKYQDK